MRLFGHLFGTGKVPPDLLYAIERAVSTVEPLLKQTGGYPDRYRDPVTTALSYVHDLAAEVPGPVTIDRESYARDPFVHALFPDIEFIGEAINSSVALQDYLRDAPDSSELYALMGMRRFEKSVAGMELSGSVVQRDVIQKQVYFSSHTLENPAPNEHLAREAVGWSFFDSLLGKVRRRVERRKQEKHAMLLERDMLVAHLRNANDATRPELEAELDTLMCKLESLVESLELDQYVADFEAVLLHPEEYLYLDSVPITLDSMGIRRAGDDEEHGHAIPFSELIGYDRRDWTVTMVCCSNVQSESFAEKLDQAYRKLVL